MLDAVVKAARLEDLLDAVLSVEMSASINRIQRSTSLRLTGLAFRHRQCRPFRGVAHDQIGAVGLARRAASTATH